MFWDLKQLKKSVAWALSTWGFSPKLKSVPTYSLFLALSTKSSSPKDRCVLFSKSCELSFTITMFLWPKVYGILVYKFNVFWALIVWCYIETTVCYRH